MPMVSCSSLCSAKKTGTPAYDVSGYPAGYFIVSSRFIGYSENVIECERACEGNFSHALKDLEPELLQLIRAVEALQVCNDLYDS